MTWPYYDEPETDDLDLVALEQERAQKGRIQPGEVRNPRGRPRGRRNRSLIIRKVALQKFAVTEKGRRRKRTAVEIVLLMVRSKAAKGDTAAMKLFDGLQLRYSPRDAIPPRTVLIVPETLTEEEFAARYETIYVNGDRKD